MARGWRWAALLAVSYLLSACSGGVTTMRLEGGRDFSAGFYVQTGAQNGINAVVIRNSPFPPEAVLAAMRARYQSNQYRFDLGTPVGWNGYTVIIGFGQLPVGSGTLCSNPDLPQAPSPPDVIELLAAYCYGNRLVTSALGRGPSASGPDDPRFRDLIGQTVAELFTNDVLAYRSGSRPLVMP